MAGVSPAFFAREGRSLIALAWGSAERRPTSAMFACKHLVGRDSVEPRQRFAAKALLSASSA